MAKEKGDFLNTQVSIVNFLLWPILIIGISILGLKIEGENGPSKKSRMILNSYLVGRPASINQRQYY